MGHGIDFALDEEQLMIVDTVRRFVREELLPHEDQVERDDHVSPELAHEIRAKSRAAGLAAFNMPAEVGGGGLNYLMQALVERELAQVGWGLHVHVARPSKILMACTGDYQRETYLLPCVAGEKTDCFALTEPGAGSDATAIQTRAVRDGEDFLITGSKHFISHADVADFTILFAVTGTQEYKGRRRNEVTAFLLDMDTPGLEVQPARGATANRGYHTAALFLDNCRVHERNVLGTVGKGWDEANDWLTAGRVMVAANCVGQAMRAQDMAVQWAGERVQFGKRIGDNQGVSFKLADMATGIAAANLLTLDTARKMDAGVMTDAEAGMAKLFASEVLGNVVDDTVQIFGGLGLMHEVPVERLWRNARIERIWEGTSEIQRHIIAKSLLGAR
ncbi:MAG: acyl-CoA dehydrogenase family protein [Sphingomonadales bacterium]|nr:acyl-CoA dehydrogenase family protein [Sphingomonadales bacterium]